MLNQHLYILVGQHAVPAKNLEEWTQFMQGGDQRVAIDEIEGLVLSTVFLGINLEMRSVFRKNDQDPLDPILFETAVISDDVGEVNVLQRYFTWAEAQAGHQEICAALREVLSAACVQTDDAIFRVRSKLARRRAGDGALD